MRAKLVVGNWKMNPATVDAAAELAASVASIAGEGVEVGVAPAAIALARVREALRGTPVRVFAQDVHWEPKGAHTGQIAATMLVGLADGSIVGHSEVRRDLGDDDARVAAKATAALSHGLRAIYCVGESLAERRKGEMNAVLERQVRRGIGAIPKKVLGDGTRLAIAYEPIWAIGTGEAATGRQASEAVERIRYEVAGLGLDADALTVVYGGSVTASNVLEFARADGVDGALVGGASLDPGQFSAIVAAFR